MKALLIFSNGSHLFFILSTFNTASLKVFKKICRKKSTSEQYGEGEILTGVERVVMGTNGTILLKSPNKSHITSHITDSTL